MSTSIDFTGGTVTQWCGPDEGEGADRRRYTLTLRSPWRSTTPGCSLDLDRKGVADLITVLEKIAGLPTHEQAMRQLAFANDTAQILQDRIDFLMGVDPGQHSVKV